MILVNKLTYLKGSFKTHVVWPNLTNTTEVDSKYLVYFRGQFYMFQNSYLEYVRISI